MSQQNVPQANPANAAVSAKDQAAPERKRIPFSVRQRKLEVPEISGYHLHWFRESNVPRALQAGYEMVKAEEVPINQFGVGNSKSISGNMDLGSGVKVVGGEGERGEAVYLCLMKIRLEWWLEDQKAIEQTNLSTLQAIFKDKSVVGDSQQSADSDTSQRYVKQALLQRPPRKKV